MTEKRAWIYDLLLVVVLIMAAYFRLIGLNWDENQHLHPDERFMTMVESALQPVQSFSQYFDTRTSTLNPNNVGYGFYVYGDLPLIVVRYLAQWFQQTGYDQVHLIGRQVSAVSDLGVIFLLYLIASRLYGRKVGLLAAAFSALTVMQIQQSHFFTTDNPGNFFGFLAIFFAILIAQYGPGAENPDSVKEDAGTSTQARIVEYLTRLSQDPLLWLSAGFGLALGMAVSSKLNAAPMAILLPAAFFFRHLQLKDKKQSTNSSIETILVYLVVGGFISLLTFRIFQPYAFNGLGINAAWLKNIQDLQAQSNGNADVPFALQWARRSHLYSFDNLTQWGLGLPLGILAWAGFLWMAWRLVKGEWQHALLWGWTAIYFTWQSLAFNPTMRYQLPIYPLLGMMAAWLTFNFPTLKRINLKPFALVIGGIVLVLTGAWAYAFTRIYTVPHTRVAATRWIYQNLPGPITLDIQQTGSDVYHEPLPFPYGSFIQPGTPYSSPFTAYVTGTLSEVYLPHVAAVNAPNQTLNMVLGLQPDTPPEQALATATLTADFDPGTDGRGQGFTLKLNHPVQVTKDQTYFLRLEASGTLTLQGAAPINESSWDDGLPLRMDGYDAYGGLYNGNLNFEMYFDDNADKVARFVSNMTQGDYIFITSNRQWASITRIPERYPLTTEYYRLLIGCPAGKDIIWCYNVAKPGEFKGQLGFDLVKVFESYPTIDIPGLLHWQVDDQFAEEAFTVYDHPKVLIFKKSADFDASKVQALLGAVDLSNVVHLTPGQATTYKSLMLPADKLAQQQAGGTWSDLFNYDWLQNRYPYLGLLLWYVFVFVLGLVSYPLTRLALPGLQEGSYPLSRILGLALLAYLSWLGGSVGIPYTRASIGLALGLITVAGLGVAWMRREQISEDWKSHRRFFLIVEGLFLAFFLFDLFIRIGNPDLWHPAKGGERPMDFSYLNAVLKSTSFPPYDPWYAGGYINYYYYGFVLVGTPVKLLGIVPSIAYNFILPTLFAMVAMGAFTVGSQLVQTAKSKMQDVSRSVISLLTSVPVLSGIFAALLTVVLGNLGTVQMLYQGFQRMAAPGGVIDNANIFQRWIWAATGLFKAFTGTPLPFGPGDWYWFPSRVIPAPNDVQPITEFPFFTFLYSDLHAHMIVLPLALFVIAWVISIIKTRARMTPLEWLASFFAGGMMIGAIYPTNLSDLYTYLLIALAVLACVLWFYADVSRTRWLPSLSPLAKRLAVIAVALITLTGLSFFLYEPYRAWYSQFYGGVDPWLGSHTPIWSYLTHWGLFLFLIVSWMVWETREWMANTPASSLSKLRPFALWIEGVLAVIVLVLLYLAFKGVQVSWLALPLAVWAGVLLLRPGLADEKRFVLFLVGTALLITIVVEVVVVRGDIGRMNTVFKFYLQAWVMLAVSAAAAFGWLLMGIPQWLPSWRTVFQSGLTLLTAGALLFTITAATDKIHDRMAPQAPHTLDSMTYMKYATYSEFAHDFPLGEDYDAIRWLQDNVKGSPVIVEAAPAGVQYAWLSRITIYTGLPGVVGWQWHQQQQRVTFSDQVVQRGVEVDQFYNTTDQNAALAFLHKYNVRYIIVGQLELAKYTPTDFRNPNGLTKFEQYNGVLWKDVFHSGATVIYEVIQ